VQIRVRIEDPLRSKIFLLSSNDELLAMNPRDVLLTMEEYDGTIEAFKLESATTIRGAMS
jgi:hypothetical protein